MPRTRVIPVLGALAASAALVLAGCTAPVEPESEESAIPQTPVTAIISNPFSVVQYYGAYLVGIDQGFFSDAGIDLTIQEGSGSATSAQVVAAGNAEFGLSIGAVAVVNSNDAGAGLKFVGVDSPVATYSVVSLGAAIEEPEDLEGKTIGVPEGTTQGLLWPAFLEEAGVDPSTVSTVNVSPASAVTTLAQGRVDGIVTYTNSAVPGLAAIGEDDPTVLMFSDYGITVAPDAGIITTDALIEEDPDLVARFMEAVQRSLDYAAENPDAIYAVGSELYPDSFNETIIAAQAEILATALGDYGIEGEPSTYIPLDAFSETIQLLAKVGAITTARSAAFYATNDFIPEP